MVQDPFYTFIDFVTCNNTISQLRRQSEQLATRIAELDEQIDQAHRRRDVAYQTYTDLYKQQHKQENEASDVSQQLKNKREQLSQTALPKEYQSLQKEIERLQGHVDEADNAVEQIWQQVEDALNAYYKEHETYQNTYQECTKEKEQLEHQQQELQDQIAQYEKQQAELRESVKPEWLEAFDRKRAQVADPVVPVTHNVCSVCFSTIPRNDLRKLERHVILTCPGCHRLLYHM